MGKGPPDIRVTKGPSLFAPHKAVIVTFDQSHFRPTDPITKQQIAKLNPLVPEFVLQKGYLENIGTFSEALVELIRSLLDFRMTLDLSMDIKILSNGHYRLIIEYFYEDVVINAVNIAFSLIDYMSSDHQNPTPQLSTYMRMGIDNQINLTSGTVVSHLIKSARSQNVPYYTFENVASMQSYGQGKHSVFINHGCTDRDSSIGMTIQKSKTDTNAFLKMVGYPTTDQGVAQTLDQCRDIVSRFGFPVAIKPPADGLGNGVTSNIKTDDAVEPAFAFAKKYSKGPVLIEKHIYGGDYRITVSEGKIGCVTERKPASVTGDGSSTIEQLIEQENIDRIPLYATEEVIKPVIIDDGLLDIITTAGYSLDSIPEEGEFVQLRNNINISTGGKRRFVDMEELHPDVVDMCVDIARLLRLDSLGIDYITNDIGKSWREHGVIIEVNAYPMMNAVSAANMMKYKFANKNNGRIDSCLVISNQEEFRNNALEEFTAGRKNIGIIDSSKIYLNNLEKNLDKKDTYNLCLSLMVDTKCEGIGIALPLDQIIREGLPLDIFGSIVIDKNCGYSDGDIVHQIQSVSGKKDISQWLGEFTDNVEIR